MSENRAWETEFECGHKILDRRPKGPDAECPFCAEAMLFKISRALIYRDDAAALLATQPEESADAKLIRQMEQATALICWECRKVHIDIGASWWKNGCPDCGSHGYVLPFVIREKGSQPEDVGEPLTREDYGGLIGACQHMARHAMRVAKVSQDESDLDIVEKWDRLADKCESRMDELPASPTRHPTKEAENGA